MLAVERNIRSKRIKTYRDRSSAADSGSAFMNGMREEGEIFVNNGSHVSRARANDDGWLSRPRVNRSVLTIGDRAVMDHRRK